MLLNLTILFALLPSLIRAAAPAPAAQAVFPDRDRVRHTYKEYLSGSSEPRHPSPGYKAKAAQKADKEASALRAPKYGYEDAENAAFYAMRAEAGARDPNEKAPFPPYNTWEAYWGLKTFGHTKPVRCMTADNTTLYDIAILGAPFDTATSWRPGARFGPGGIRGGAQRLGGANRLLGNDAFQELEIGASLTVRSQLLKNGEESLALDGQHHPRVMMLGGDHTIVLPALRALNEVYGPVLVIHFDSHCDSRHPDKGILTHGDYFYFAWKEGLMSETNIHAGIRSNCDIPSDLETNFATVLADEIEDIGWKGVIKRIKDRVGDSPVYLTIDIDTLDPAFAPATGTPEIGGWTSREMIEILHGLKDLKIVGADVVEVAPAYDTTAEITQIAAAGLVFELLSMMALTPVVKT
nr:agmatinase [Kwoniella mangroviensis CBS 8507]OCF66000.1 agmatinase [Kwoniella mangroviensis CBS 8507]